MPPLPKAMSGVIIEKPGGVEVLQWKTDLPVPELKEGEILVKNEYIGVNYIDTYDHYPLTSALEYKFTSTPSSIFPVKIFPVKVDM